jgi:hypothetical protein
MIAHTLQDMCQLHVVVLSESDVVQSQVSITDTYNFVDQNSHPRLWRLLAETVRPAFICLSVVSLTSTSQPSIFLSSND